MRIKIGRRWLLTAFMVCAGASHFRDPATYLDLNMAINGIPLGAHHLPAWALWGRLPLQVVLIGWAFWYTREDRAPRSRIQAG